MKTFQPNPLIPNGPKQKTAPIREVGLGRLGAKTAFLGTIIVIQIVHVFCPMAAVPTEAERDIPEHDAWCVLGVEDVINHIEVKMTAVRDPSPSHRREGDGFELTALVTRERLDLERFCAGVGHKVSASAVEP